LKQGIIFIEQAIFGAEQGLLAFLRVGKRLGRRPSSVTSIPVARPCHFPPINYPDGARKPGFDDQT
jgi:hypothetical protein